MPHTVEEAYEVADAAVAGTPEKLLDELGDLLFQVTFLALLLEEQGAGGLEDVARRVHEKLVRRHPHVFGHAEARTAARVRERWESIKSEQEGREGIFHDVPAALPGLLQARKVQRRAAAVGYDWPDLGGPLGKLHEELEELEREIARAGVPAPETEPDPGVVAEVGDLLFTVVNVARRLNVDPELALRATTARWTERVETAVELAAAAGEDWAALDLDGQDRWYERAKAQLAPRRPMPEAPRVVAAGYDAIADRYAAWAAGIEGDPRDRYVERLLALLPANPRILEIGCGAAVEPTPTLARMGTLVGIDLSARQLARARDAVPNGTFLLADIVEADFDPASFDAVVALYVLTHVSTADLPGLLWRIATWLRPGGLFLATLGTRGPHDSFVEDWLGAPTFFSGLETDENERLVRAAGLVPLASQVESMVEPPSEPGGGREHARFHWILATRSPTAD